MASITRQSTGLLDPYSVADDAATRLRELCGVEAHDIAVVLGSGWAGVADEMGVVRAEVEMSALPGFPAPQVPGHLNVARSMVIDHRSILVLGGRSHLYEGFPPESVVHGVRVAAASGCRAMILTNAAGSLRPEWEPGRLVLIRDHLNLTGHSPMAGPTPPAPLPGRFCDMSVAYSPRLRSIARNVHPALPDGVYAGLLGANFETPAEIAMLRTLGADLVGMSTVLETIAARHLGMDVLGISLVTNLAAGLSPEPLSHGDVLAAASIALPSVVDLIQGVLRHLWTR